MGYGDSMERVGGREDSAGMGRMGRGGVGEKEKMEGKEEGGEG